MSRPSRQEGELIGIEGVEGEVHAREAGGGHGGEFSVQGDAVGRDAEFFQAFAAQLPNVVHERDDILADGGFAACEADLCDALGDEEGG